MKSDDKWALFGFVMGFLMGAAVISMAMGVYVRTSGGVLDRVGGLGEPCYPNGTCEAGLGCFIFDGEVAGECHKSVGNRSLAPDGGPR